MKAGKKTIVVLIPVIILILLIPIIFAQKKAVTTVKEEKQIKIGFTMDTLVIDRWQRDRDIFVAKAKELGAEVITLSANEDNAIQVQQIEYLIEQAVDVIVVIPYDKKGVTEAVKAAKKRGIKVIAYDRLILDANVDLYISFDNQKVGELMCKRLVDRVPQGNYIIINGSSRDNNTAMFNSGYKEVLQDYIDRGRINIIKEVWAEDWREDIAYNCVDEAIAAGERIDAIVAANDRLAEAAIQALAENRITAGVEVAGHDADLSACQRIVEGTQLSTVYKPIRLLAEGAAEAAIKLAGNEEVAAENEIFDGTHRVPYEIYDVIAVTRDNMLETVIKDGFHTKEDVYRNVERK